ncbi:MAG: bifunctional diaminohydroxyphosphoribosylaminopyrimidine deaminase/5-amino-6-(5-phosphoribosylamino)uracil reductase RibD [Syntrophaceae bacterium]
MNDEFYMKRALRLARRGESWASPNPMVGSVIVKEGRIIGEGYHQIFGGNHAEINAIDCASESIEGATVYVSLEPCTHYGKTPPCCECLITQKPARVVIGTADPNPLVSGQGIDSLKRHGIETTVGVLKEECLQLNERFFKFMKTGIPFITLKFAQTIDGRIATASGHSRWISSARSLRLAHRLRSSHDAVLVGVNTLIQDNPELTVRLVRGRNPLRVIVDSSLRIPMDAQVLMNQNAAQTIVATTAKADPEKLAQLKGIGIETLMIGDDTNHRVDLKKLFIELGKRNISSVLIEGGSAIITSTLKSKLPDRIVVVIAPKIVGKGIDAVGDLNIHTMDESMRLTYGKIRRLGNDLIIDGRFA